MDVAVDGIYAYYSVAVGDCVWQWVGIEFAAYLDGPDLALHSGRVGGVKVGLGEFLEAAEAHDACADSDLVVACKFDVLENFVQGGFGYVDGLRFGDWRLRVEGWRDVFGVSGAGERG